jgi:DNA mismatch repair protein MutS2
LDKRVLEKLEFPHIRRQLAQHTLSDLGKALALSLEPESEYAAVEKLLQETGEAEHIIMSSSGFPLRGFRDIVEEIGRLRVGATLSCAELLRVAELHKAAKHANRSIGRIAEQGLLTEMASLLWYDDVLISRIDEAILSEEEIADNASGELRAIRRQIRNEHGQVREKLNSIIRSKEYATYLQDAIITSREGRFVVPVKQEFRGQVPGLIHGQSASGATLFIEPMGIVESNNKLRLLEEEERREIERILAEISSMASVGADAMRADLDILAYLDLVFAKASLAIQMKAFAPQLATDDKIIILAGRHPLIEESEVIPVSVQMEAGIKTLIITGPNTGGKTVTLKLIGLFALMAQSGLFLPAQAGTKLPVFPAVYADIGDEQSIEQSLSTFSAHMHNIIFILRRAEKGALVLLDELGAGTDPEEGTALALAMLSELYEKDTHVFATTHYGEIKAYAMAQDGFENASMEFDANSLRPTFRLIMGSVGASNAFLISKRLGLKNHVIEKAERFMKEERLEFNALLLEAERTRRTAETRLDEIRKKEEEVKEAQKKAKALEQELGNRREEMLQKAREEAYTIVEQAKSEMEAAIKEARVLRNQTEREATKSTEVLRRVVTEKSDTLKKQLRPKKQPQQRMQKEELIPGQTVHVMSLRAEGTVVEAPDAKGNVTVQVGIMTVQVPISDLAYAKGSSNKKVIQRSRTPSGARKAVPMSLNLHGYNVEDAMIEIDKYLDDAFLSGLSEVSINHGKGTGVLRKGVQDFLRRHPHVASFRRGEYGEGDSGVTIVTIKGT